MPQHAHATHFLPPTSSLSLLQLVLATCGKYLMESSADNIPGVLSMRVPKHYLVITLKY